MEGRGETYRAGASSGIAKMGKAHVTGEVVDTLAVLKDFGRHAIAFALEDPTARSAGRYTASILSAVLEVVQTLV